MSEPTERKPSKRKLSLDSKKEVEDISKKVPRTKDVREINSISKKEENFLRIVYLNYRVATGALRLYFNKRHPNLSAELHIKENIDTLRQLYDQLPPGTSRRVLHTEQWKILYPPGRQEVTSADLDLTLMVCLLRNLPPVVKAPLGGFDELPHPKVKRAYANIARLKYYKNFLVSHSSDGQLSEVEFVSIWNTLEKAIKGLDNSRATYASLKDAKTKILDNSMVELLSTLLQLDATVSSILDKLGLMTKKLNTMNEETVEKFGNIEKELIELKKWQNCLESRFTSIETIVKGSKEEKNKFETDVKSICRQCQEYVREKIQTCEDKYVEVQRDLGSLKATTECIQADMKKNEKENNIRAENLIRGWEEDQSTFVETRATRHLLGSLHLQNCIIVTGSSGSGKSSIIHHVALQLRDKFGYEIIPAISNPPGPSDILNYYDENKKQVFVVDNICGKETINMHTLQTWRDCSDMIAEKIRIAEKDVANTNADTVLKVLGPKLLISCRLHIFKEPKFQHVPLFAEKECNLQSPELCLLPEERMRMLRMYLSDDIISKLNFKLIENVDFFPLVCKMAKGTKPNDVQELFADPLDIIKWNIENTISANEHQPCALTLCIIFDDGFNTEWLKLGAAPQEKRDRIKEIGEEFGIMLNKEKDRKCLKTAFSTLDGTFLEQRGTGYIIIHDMIYKLAAVLCGQNRTECFIKYASSGFIEDRFIFESITETLGNDYLITLSKDHEEEFFERLLCDLKHDDITSTFHNSQLIYQPFREKLIGFFRRKNDAISVLKNLDLKGSILQKDQDIPFYGLRKTDCITTPLMESASRGYCDIAHFLIATVKCDVNKKDGHGSSPLHEASLGGHSDVIDVLLGGKAFINQCDLRGKSPLYLACEGGYKKAVKLLLQFKADISQCENNNRSPLHASCERGHTDIVKLLLKENADIYKCDFGSNSPLHLSCENGHKEIVKILLQNNADVSVCNTCGKSPLDVACAKGYTEIVNLLLQSNADVYQPSHGHPYKEPALHVACADGLTEIVKLLLKYNANVSQRNSDGMSPLYVAIKEERTETVKVLLQNEADLSECDNYGNSLLLIACIKECFDIVNLLLQFFADVNHCNNDGESPLFVACQTANIDIVKLLLQNSADLAQCNNKGKSPFYVACKKGRVEIVKLLLQKFAGPARCNNKGKSPLYVACKEGNVGIVELLLENNADASQFNNNQISPLFVACQYEYEDIVRLLLQYNANSLHCNTEGESPLYEACQHENIEIVKLLLQHSADPNQNDNKGYSPLCMACQEGNLEIIKLLLQSGANVSQSYNDGMTLLYSACEWGYTELVELLLQHNANISRCNNNGESPLFVACQKHDISVVELLLQYKADVSLCNNDGESPLHAACEGGSLGFVKILLQNKADPSLCNNKGQSSLYVACKESHVEIVRLLLQWNADVSISDNNGQTPLDIARKSQCGAIVNLLEKNLQLKA